MIPTGRPCSFPDAISKTTDVNHQVSKALIDRGGENTLFVVEDLSNVRKATERVRKKDRYVSVSWSFYQLRSMIEYKAALNLSKVIAVDPAYTSQACPMCGHTEKETAIRRRIPSVVIPVDTHPMMIASAP